ncbi:hypothetical protein EV652_10659 [Kribbella steppae]|uniref:Uncharacterized protein n=1 Tax=Kribbella steppae TaxID=2512223 RepID=A0A4R2HGI8_9ACTN|nr:hypothetical protein [Kribbella steppae]TCO28077.1 hypothetical protein EV652_10659 [Kribbella steppae]
MDSTDTEGLAVKQERPKLRFPMMANDQGGIGGVHLGDVCHNHVLTEVYADFDGEGHLVQLHTHDIGSC